MVDLVRRKLVTLTRGPAGQLSLPWLFSQQQFVDACTRCNKCVDACETQIIQIGAGGFPHADLTIDECTLCYRCANVCSEPLFKAEPEAPWQADIQLTDRCLALQNIDCRSCADACEPMAIQFKPIIGKVAQPNLQTESCTGCGACISPCPADAINLVLRET